MTAWGRGLAAALLLVASASGLAEPRADGFAPSPQATVTDAQRGLVWMRCSLGQHLEQGRCLGEAERLSWSEAQARVAALATAACPWRLPHFHELRSLMAPQADADIAIDGVAFPDTPAGWYWNQASAGGHSQQDCFVDFAGAGRTRCNMGGQFHLRLVMPAEQAENCLLRK